ncbi:MAG TPA: hypothetical protein VIB62_02785 [Actinomycetota bacterium]
MLRTIRAAVVAIVLVAVAGAACAGDEDPPGAGADLVPATGTPSEATPPPSLDVVVGELPDGFPTSFPLPEGSEPSGSASIGAGYVVWFSSQDVPIDDLPSFFNEELPAEGWTIVSEVDVSQGGVDYHAFEIEGHGYTGGIYLGEGAPGAEDFEGEYAFWVRLSPA